MQNNNKLAYVLPNLFTAASIFLAVLSIFASIGHEVHKAVLLIIVSLVCDGLDGRVARLTHTTSKFGVEFDSLADVIAFGVAPAMLFYFNVGYEFGRYGSLVCAIFIIFGAIRLARFNVTTGTYEPNVFIGLPIPSAAVAASLSVSMFYDYSLSAPYGIAIMVFMLLLSFLMVSNVRYPSFKKIQLKKANILKVLVLLVFLLSLIYIKPLEISWAVMMSYVFYGIVRLVYIFISYKMKNSKNNTSEDGSV